MGGFAERIWESRMGFWRRFLVQFWSVTWVACVDLLCFRRSGFVELS